MALEEYRKQIANLSVNDQKLRDLHLRKLALGEIQGPPTGYASLDKPWLKYYEEDGLKSDYESMTMYNFLKNQNSNNKNGVAINYFGNKVTYSNLFKEVEELALKLDYLGFKKNDTISICAVTCPEIIYSIYALNRLGITINMIDPRSTKKQIIDSIESTNSNGLIILEPLLDKNVELTDELKNIKIIDVDPKKSLPFYLKFADLLKKSKKIEKGNLFYYDKLIYDKKRVLDELGPNNKAVIVYTGGTTGKPKGVILSDDNFNQMPFQYKYSQYDLKKNQKFLNIITPTFAYGVCNSIHLPLALGMEVDIVPVFNPDKFLYYMKKYKPNHSLGVPRYWLSLMDNKGIENQDLSFLMNAGCGGDAITESDEKKLEDFFAKHNSKSKVAKGYGMTELSSAVIVCNKKANKLGSVGIPMIKSSMKIIDENNNELGYGQVGEICLQSTTMMQGYYNNPKETDKIIHYDSNGEKWIHTGDLGYIDQEGNLFIKGRIKRMIIKRGMKIFPSEIEELINESPIISNSCVVGVPDDEFVEIPIAYIVKEDKTVSDEKCIESVKDICEKNLRQYAVPSEYIVIDKIPLTAMGKNDFLSLKNQYIKNNEL